MPTNMFGPSSISTTTNTSPFYENDYELFFANSQYWLIFYDGTTLRYTSSNDGLNWASPSGLGTINGGNAFSAFFDGTYVHYVTYGTSANNTLCYRRGIPGSGGVITWSAAEQNICQPSSTLNTMRHIEVCPDTNGHPYVIYEEQQSGNVESTYMRASSTTDGTWSNTFTTTVSSSAYAHNALCQMAGGTMAALFEISETNIDSYWLTITGTLTADGTLPITSSTYDQCWSAMSNSGTLYVAYDNGGNIVYNTKVGTTWGTGTTIVTSVGAVRPVVSTTTSGNQIVFYCNSTGGFELQCIAGTWGSVAQLFSQTVTSTTAVLGWFNKTNGAFAMTWLQNSSSPYTIEIAILPIGNCIEYSIDLMSGYNGAYYNTTSGPFVLTVVEDLANYTATNYMNPTVYFEAVMYCSSSSGTVSIELIDNNSGTYPSNGTLTVVGNTATRVRSNALSLTSGHDFYVGIGTSTGTGYFGEARLVIVDTWTGTWSAVENQIEIGDGETSSQTSAAPLVYAPQYYHETGTRDGTVTTYWEVNMDILGSGTVWAELYDITASAAVSTLSTTSTSLARVRSGAITLTNAHLYEVKYWGNVASNINYIFGAKIIIEQSGTITHTQLYKKLGTSLINGGTGTSYCDQDFYIEKTNLPPAFSVYWEASTESNSTLYTATAYLTDLSTGNMTSTNTTNTTWTRARSGALNVSEAHTLDTTITSSSSSGTCYISDAYLIINSGTLWSQSSTDTLTCASVAPVKNVYKVLTGAATDTSSRVSNVMKSLLASITPKSSQSHTWNTFQSVSDTITAVSSVLKQAGKLGLIDTVTAASSMLKITFKSLLGSVTPASSIKKSFLKVLNGTIVPASSIVKTAQKVLAGTVTLVSSLSKTVQRTALLATLSITSTFTKVKTTFLSQLASIIAASSISKTDLHSLIGTIVASSSIFKNLQKLLLGSIQTSSEPAPAMWFRFEETADDATFQDSSGNGNSISMPTPLVVTACTSLTNFSSSSGVTLSIDSSTFYTGGASVKANVTSPSSGTLYSVAYSSSWNWAQGDGEIEYWIDADTPSSSFSSLRFAIYDTNGLYRKWNITESTLTWSRNRSYLGYLDIEGGWDDSVLGSAVTISTCSSTVNWTTTAVSTSLGTVPSNKEDTNMLYLSDLSGTTNVEYNIKYIPGNTMNWSSNKVLCFNFGWCSGGSVAFNYIRAAITDSSGNKGYWNLWNTYASMYGYSCTLSAFSGTINGTPNLSSITSFEIDYNYSTLPTSFSQYVLDWLRLDDINTSQIAKIQWEFIPSTTNTFNFWLDYVRIHTQATTTPGRFGNARYLDDRQQWMGINNNAPQLDGQNYTVCFWFYPTDTSWVTQVYTFLAYKYTFCIGIYQGGYIGANLEDTNSLWTGPEIAGITWASQWYFVGVTFQGESPTGAKNGTATIYLFNSNGTLVGSASTTGFSQQAGSNSTQMILCRAGWWCFSNDYFKGYIDEFRVYYQALSQQQLTSLCLNNSIEAPKQVLKPLTALVSPASSLLKYPAKALAATLSAFSSFAKKWNTFLTQTARVSLGSSITKMGSKLLSAILNPSSSISHVWSAFKSLSGTITLASSRVSQGMKTFLASISLASSLSHIWTAYKTISGTIVLASSIAKSASKTFLDTITAASSFSAMRSMYRTFTATVTLASSITKSFQKAGLLASIVLVSSLSHAWTSFKTLTGSITAASSRASQVMKTFLGSISPASSISHLWTAVKTLSATVTLVSSRVSNAFKLLFASITLVSSRISSTFKAFTDTITLVSSIVKEPMKVLIGAAALASSRVSRAFKNLLASITLTSAISHIWTVYKSLTGTITLASSIAKSTSKTFVDTIVATSSMTSIRTIYRTFMASITLVSSLVKAFQKAGLLATITLVSSLSHAWTDFQIFLASITLVSSRISRTLKTFVDTVTLASSRVSQVSKSLLASITLVSAILKTGFKMFSDSITLVSSWSKTWNSFKTILGSVTLVSSIFKTVQKGTFFASVTLASSWREMTTYFRTNLASITLVSSLLKMAQKLLTALVSPGSSFSRIWKTYQTMNASVTLVSNLMRQGMKSLSGSISLVSSYLKTFQKALVGSITLISAFTRIFNSFRSFVGTIVANSSWSSVKGKFLTLVGTITLSSSFSRTVQFFRTLQASISSLASSVYKSPFKTFVDSITLASSYTKIFLKALSGTITLVSSIAKRVSKTFTDSVTLVSSLNKLGSKTLAGSVILTSSVVKMISKSLSGTVSLASSISKTLKKLFSGTLVTNSLFAKVWKTFFTLTGQANPSASIFKLVQKGTFSASLTLVSSITKAISKSLLGSIALVSAISKMSLKTLTDTITLVFAYSKAWTSKLSELASLTLASSLTKRMMKTSTDSVVLVSSILKSAVKIFPGTITLASSLTHAWNSFKTLVGSITLVSSMTYVKAVFKSLYASLTLTSSFARAVQFYRTLSGAAILTSSVLRNLGKVLASKIVLTSSIVKTSSKALAASVLLASSLSILRTFYRTLTGSASLKSSVSSIRQVFQTLYASLALVSQLSRNWTVYKILTGAISLVSSWSYYVVHLALVLTGGIVLASSRVSQIGKGFFGSLTTSASSIRSTRKVLQANLVLGSLVMLRNLLTFTGAMILASSMTKLFSTVKSGVISLSSSLIKGVKKSISATINLGSSLAKLVAKSFAALSSMAGSSVKTVQSLKIASVVLSPSTRKLLFRSFSQSLRISPNLLKQVMKPLLAQIVLTPSTLRVFYKNLFAILQIRGVMYRWLVGIFIICYVPVLLGSTLIATVSSKIYTAITDSLKRTLKAPEANETEYAQAPEANKTEKVVAQEE